MWRGGRGRRSSTRILRNRLARLSNDPSQPFVVHDSDGDSSHDDMVQDPIYHNPVVEEDASDGHQTDPSSDVPEDKEPDDLEADQDDVDHVDPASEDNELDEPHSDRGGDDVDPVDCASEGSDEDVHVASAVQETTAVSKSGGSGHSKKRKRSKLTTNRSRIVQPKITSAIRWTKSMIAASSKLTSTSMKKLVSPRSVKKKASKKPIQGQIVTPSASRKKASVTNVRRPVVSPKGDLSKPMVFSNKTSPSTMVDCVQFLTNEQKEAVREIGFGGLLGMKLTRCPIELGRYLVERLDDKRLVINTDAGRIGITCDLVYDIFGVPNGGFDIDNIVEEDDDSELVATWLKQFKVKKQNITKGDIVDVIRDSGDSGILFKLNFITLFANVICKSYRNGFCMTSIVNKIAACPDIPALDWCLYIQECVKGSKKQWKMGRSRYSYAGPMTLLMISYLHHVITPNDKVPRTLPAICNWDIQAVRSRQKYELAGGGFGRFRVLSSESALKKSPGNKSTQSVSPDADEVVILDLKAKLLRMARYKAEIDAELTSRLDSNPMHQQFASLKNEFDSLFSPAVERTQNHMQIGSVTITTPLKQTPQTVDVLAHAAVDVSATLPSTPVHLVIKSTVGGSAQKNPLNSPVSPETLKMVSDIEMSIYEKSTSVNLVPTVTEVTRMVSLRSIKDVPRMASLDDDVPSFDLNLGFTQTQQTITTNVEDVGCRVISNGQSINVVTPYDHPHDVAQDGAEDYISDEEARDHEPLSKRMKKVSAYNKSPYYKRQVIVDEPLKAVEVRVSERLFSLQGDVGFHLFETEEYGLTTRNVMETLIPTSWVAADVINAWATVLNYEESFKAVSSPARVFINLKVMDGDMFAKDCDEEAKYREFAKGLNLFMERFTERRGFRNVKIVFFPVFHNNHYYGICFDLSRALVYVLDNRKDFPPEYYLMPPHRLIKWFSRYLRQEKHQAASKLAKQSPKFTKMKCQTHHNDEDCGIFVMRHMETFRGGAISRYDCGLKREGPQQSDQIEILRRKYATKILTCDLNINKPIVLAESQQFAQIPSVDRQRILDEAFARKDDRLGLV